ncbi:MAG: ferrous iron transporter B, partial [Bdellovibrionales bacterium]|nr:ferrous iron transporter B [Bdellovibrionales bacterium]
GLYSLKPNTLDEQVALRHLEESRGRGHVVAVVDGNNLEQELTLPMMLKEKGYSLTVAVNMMDEVAANRKILNLAGMTELAGVPFFGISARTGEGVDALKKHLARARAAASQPSPILGLSNHEVEQAYRMGRQEGLRVAGANPPGRMSALLLRDQRVDRWVLHPVLSPIFFLLVMFTVFQSVFTWAVPFSDLLESAVAWMGGFVKAHVTWEMGASLLADGVLGGVGSVIVFLPPIAILFFLIGLLEYSGYLPRIAFLVDRLMKPWGLDGKVFIPLLSSVACAVPGIMATRTIENHRVRLITIMISPLMTCSARLPVYALLIGTFIPSSRVMGLSLQGLVMFGMYLVGIMAALGVALVLHRLGFERTQPTVEIIHLPHYRTPDWRSLGRFVLARVTVFLKKAGTVIAGMSILLWLLLTFPRDKELAASFDSRIEAAATAEEEERLENERAAALLERSAGGRIGHILEPVFAPIGYDWRLTIGVLSAQAAREVFVATLGTIFALGASEDGEGLSATLLAARNPDGTPLYNLGTCLSLLAFFAFSLQCVSTIGVAVRETNSWKIPALMWVYMFVLAYGAAFLAYQLGLLLSGAY